MRLRPCSGRAERRPGRDRYVQGRSCLLHRLQQGDHARTRQPGGMRSELDLLQVPEFLDAPGLRLDTDGANSEGTHGGKERRSLLRAGPGPAHDPEALQDRWIPDRRLLQRGLPERGLRIPYRVRPFRLLPVHRQDRPKEGGGDGRRLPRMARRLRSILRPLPRGRSLLRSPHALRSSAPLFGPLHRSRIRRAVRFLLGKSHRTHGGQRGDRLPARRRAIQPRSSLRRRTGLFRRRAGPAPAGPPG